MLKQIRAAVNTHVPTMKADITARVMLGTDSWMITKDAKVQFIHRVIDRTVATRKKKLIIIIFVTFQNFLTSF